VEWFEAPGVFEKFYSGQCSRALWMPSHTLGSDSMKEEQLQLCLALEKHHGPMDQSGFTPQ
jgi:hypothetical protein